MSDEAQLIAQAAAGDDSALERLLERHAGLVRAEIGSHLPAKWRSVLSVDDVMQETFLDAFLDIARFRPAGGGFAAWLVSIARCNLVDATRMLEADKRGGGRRRIAGQGPAGAPRDDDSLVDLLDLLSGSVTTASARAGRAESAAALTRAVQALAQPHRQVVEMYDLRGLGGPETAAAVGRSLGAMFMLRARAHRQLAEHLGAPAAYLSTRA